MNISSRRGKIARLPKALREEVNRRLHDAQPGRLLAEWLNALPEVKTILAEQFDGLPITEQNLSQWRRGGYRDWLAQEQALQMAPEIAAEMAAAGDAEGGKRLLDALTTRVAVHYVVATRQTTLRSKEKEWQRLREMCADIVKLRRSDHSAQRLTLRREELDLDHLRQLTQSLERQVDDGSTV